MKMKSFIFSLLILFISACKAPDENAALVVTVGPNPTFVLPIDQTTCKQEDENMTDSPGLQAPTIELGTFKFNWKGKNNLKISYIEAVFRHGTLSGGKYTCVIAGSELAAINADMAREIAGNDPERIYSADNCGIRCGGIAFNSNVTYAYVPGILRIFAVEYDAENVGIPVVTEVDIAMEKRY